MCYAIHAGEDIVAARQKSVQVIEAELVEAAVAETLTYYAFPEERAKFTTLLAGC
jgi:hypothetical protein